MGPREVTRAGHGVRRLPGSPGVPLPLSPQPGKGVSLCSRGAGQPAAAARGGGRGGPPRRDGGQGRDLRYPPQPPSTPYTKFTAVLPGGWGELQWRPQEGTSLQPGVLLVPIKINLLVDKNKGAKSTPVFALGPVAFILLQGAGSQVPNWRGPSGFRGEIPERVGALAGCPGE